MANCDFNLSWLRLLPSLDSAPPGAGCHQNSSRLSPQEFTLFLMQIKEPRDVPERKKKKKDCSNEPKA